MHMTERLARVHFCDFYVLRSRAKGTQMLKELFKKLFNTWHHAVYAT